MFFGMIGRSYQWAAFHKPKAFVEPYLLIFHECFGTDKFGNRQMFGCWLKILSHRQHITSRCP